MRILNLSNFYPPGSRGGYEQWCQEVTDRLRARGHDVQVLTSRAGTGDGPRQDPPWVHRSLRLEMEFSSLTNALRFFTARHADERENLRLVDGAIAGLDPDCILVWGMWNLHRSIAALAERRRPGRVAYYLGDYWPTLPSQFEPYWNSPARSWLTASLKAPLRIVARRVMAREPHAHVRFEHVMFPTAFMRDELARRGLRPGRSRIVYGAVDTSLYPTGADCMATRDLAEELRLLWVGRLTHDKGAHTAIEAVARLVREHGVGQARLTIVGGGDPPYEERLRTLAHELGVASVVTFSEPRPKEALPEVYRQADVLLFTSIWPEPFGRVLVEAMASGLAVVGAATGGAAEILVDGDTALTFPPGDAGALADRILRLLREPTLRRTLVGRARRRAVEMFDIGRMTAEIEHFLGQVVGSQLPTSN